MVRSINLSNVPRTSQRFNSVRIICNLRSKVPSTMKRRRGEINELTTCWAHQNFRLALESECVGLSKCRERQLTSRITHYQNHYNSFKCQSVWIADTQWPSPNNAPLMKEISPSRVLICSHYSQSRTFRAIQTHLHDMRTSPGNTHETKLKITTNKHERIKVISHTR